MVRPLQQGCNSHPLRMHFIYGDLSAYIALVIVLLGSALTFWNIYMHCANYSRPKLQKFVVSILSCQF